MELITRVEMPRTKEINHFDRIMVLGSCFAQNMGEILSSKKFRCDINPFGILYNPLSILQALEEIYQNKTYTADDLQYDGRQWHSWMHHSSFSSANVNECCENINSRIAQSHENLNNLDFIIITWGTAYAYYLSDYKEPFVVGNCHKQKDSLFNRVRLDGDEIVDGYVAMIDRLREKNPDLKIILTISPIRHIKDGFHGNQISKSVLLLAAEKLCEMRDNIFYFPSYEIMMDELRDYRFYADDMVHPSSLAVEYIWMKFSETFFSELTKKIVEEWSGIEKALNHRPFDPTSPSYHKFLTQIVLNINRIKEKYPYFEINKEIEQCQAQLKTLTN